MRLLSCEIAHFGCLSGFKLTFAPKLNAALRENGRGKSTLAAFLRVMFFGFDNESRRDAFSNERLRYRPWGGGAYGGSVTFEAGGKQYRLERFFDERKSSGDEFRLFSLPDHLPSRDYTAAVGEELFGIDADSFERTVFAAQEDRRTAVTPGISAKIGNLSDETADMGNYDRVQTRLKKETDRLTPDRKTGEIAKLDERIAVLREQARQKEHLEETAEREQKKEADLRQKIRDAEAEESSLRKELSRRSAEKDLEAKRAVFSQLAARRVSAEEKEKKARAAFPGEVPEREALEHVLKTANTLDALSRDVVAARLTKEEEKSLQSGRERYGKGPADSGKKRLARFGFLTDLFAVCGVLLAGGSVIRWMRVRDSRDFILLAAGFFLVAAAAAAKVHTSRGAERYARLAERYQMLKDAGARLNAAVEEVNGYLVSLHMKPPESAPDSADQLLMLRDLLAELEHASAERQEADDAFQAFERENGRESPELLRGTPRGGERDAETETGLFQYQSLEQISGQADERREEIRGLEKQLSDLDRIMEQTGAELDSAGEAEAELQEELKRRQDLMHRYDVLMRTRDFLARARLSFSARYMDPIQRAFDRYYRTAAGDGGISFALDASFHLHYTECGATRDPETLSSGWRDLAGFCRRMAFVDAMFRGEKPFLIFDDPFSNLDAEKLRGALRLLDQIAAEGYQILYFTCHPSRMPDEPAETGADRHD